MLNCDFTSMFEKKFKRKPKNWTIDRIHALYLKCLERSKIRKSLLSEMIKYVVNQVPEENGERKVYAYNKRGDIIVYSIRMMHGWSSYGTSTDLLKFSNDKVKAREEKIDFIINNERLFEIGEQYCKAYNNISYLDQVVFKYLWEKVEDKLMKHYKNAESSPDTFTILIGDKKYYVRSDSQHRYGQYKKFHFGGEVKDESIEI